LHDSNDKNKIDRDGAGCCCWSSSRWFFLLCCSLLVCPCVRICCAVCVFCWAGRESRI
jgi:hypothetical protein